MGFVTVRAMKLSDVAAVCRIEAISFPTPWSAELFRDELRSGQRLALVAVQSGGTLRGYLLCRFYGDMWHVMNVAVDEPFRRRGVGRILMNSALVSTDLSGELCTLEVRQANEAAIALYASLGFERVGCRRGYYADTGEDALIMTRNPRMEEHAC